MNDQSDHAAAPSRTTVGVTTASGDELEAWLYLPEGDRPHPAVVMALGIGAIKGGVSFDDVIRVELEFLHRHAKTPSRI